MTTQQNNEWGDIPQGWEVVALGDIANFKNGVAHENDIDELGDFIVVNSKFISSDGLIIKYTLTPKQLAPLNSILIVMSDVPNGKAIAKCFFVKQSDLYTVNQRIGIIQSENESKVNSEFLFLQLNRNSYFLTFDDGVNQTNLRNKDILDCQILLPPKPEQSAIATVLSDTDKWIDSLTALIAKKQAIKSATMSQLLSGQKRLPQFANHSDGTPKTYIQTDNGKIPEDWEVVALGDLANLYQPETISSSQLQISGYPVYGANGIIGFYKNYNHEEPQVMVTCRGSTCGTVNMSVAYSWITGNAMVVNPNDRISKKFMYYLLSYQDLSTCITGSGQPQIVRTPLANFKVKIPKSPTEQTAIAQILSDMDSDIIALEHRLTKARALKQGLMHQLLTGKIRLFSGSLNN